MQNEVKSKMQNVKVEEYERRAKFSIPDTGAL